MLYKTILFAGLIAFGGITQASDAAPRPKPSDIQDYLPARFAVQAKIADDAVSGVVEVLRAERNSAVEALERYKAENDGLRKEVERLQAESRASLDIYEESMAETVSFVEAILKEQADYLSKIPKLDDADRQEYMTKQTALISRFLGK